MKPRNFLGQGKRCGQPTESGKPCQARLGWGAIRCRKHMPKTPEELAAFRAEQRANRNDDEIRDEAKFTRATFTSLALQHGLADERTIKAYDAAKRADVALSELIERHKAEMRAIAAGK